MIGYGAESGPLKKMVADIMPPTATDCAACQERAIGLKVEQKIDGFFIEGGVNLLCFMNVVNKKNISRKTFSSIP